MEAEYFGSIAAEACVATMQQQEIQIGDYNTSYKHRGIALIIAVHKARKGSEKDLQDVKQVLEKLQFDVRTCIDSTAATVRQVLETVSKEDHSRNDCFLIVAMAHGSKDKIKFIDRDISIDELWMDFVGNNCPSLIGKPKFIFVQSCRGRKQDTGAYLIQTDAAPNAIDPVEVCFPMFADLLVMYSSYEDHVSYRSTEQGSWFIQSLCQVLDSNIVKIDVLQLLTHVIYVVARRNLGTLKQVPVINSTLSKKFYFVPKSE